MEFKNISKEKDRKLKVGVEKFMWMFVPYQDQIKLVKWKMWYGTFARYSLRLRTTMASSYTRTHILTSSSVSFELFLNRKTKKKLKNFERKIIACVSTLGSIVDLFLTFSQFLEAHVSVLDIMYQRAI